MTEKLFDPLEVCLQALERGEDVETALRRYPDLAAELRPLLESSRHARTLAAFEVPEGAVRRGRARLLQRAAELREAKRAPRRSFLFTFRPLAVTLMLVLFFLGGTGLVRASSGALPGDNLYPVKRSWEDLQLLFVTDEVEREGLELEYENERLEEIHELLARGRTEEVAFSGYVIAVHDGQLNVGGLPVHIAGAALPVQPVTTGAAVTVSGTTRPDGAIQASQVSFLPPGAVIPTVEPEEFEPEDSEEADEETPQPESNDQEEPDSPSTPEAPEEEDLEEGRLEGVIELMQGGLWLVDGRPVDISGARIIGTPVVGATVRIEGYYTADGRFVATRIEVLADDSSDGNTGDDENSNEENSNNTDDNTSNDNDNTNDDADNDNDNDNDNTNDDNDND
ncbi:MAG: DUF5667 domain-containing protein [Chloroflexota bacterium]